MALPTEGIHNGTGYGRWLSRHGTHSDTVTPTGGNLATFLASLFFVIGLLLVGGAPVFVVAWRKGRTEIARRFLIAAGVIGLFFAVTAVASERLVERCGATGNTACFDVGYRGFLFAVAGGYVITSVIAAVKIGRD